MSKGHGAAEEKYSTKMADEGNNISLSPQEEEEFSYVEALWSKKGLETANPDNGYTGSIPKRRKPSQKAIAAVRRRAEEEIATKGLVTAYHTLIDLMGEKYPGPTRLGAAKEMISLNGMAQSAASGPQKRMEELTASELADMIAKMDGVLHQRAETAKPVIPVVLSASPAQPAPGPAVT